MNSHNSWFGARLNAEERSDYAVAPIIELGSGGLLMNVSKRILWSIVLLALCIGCVHAQKKAQSQPPLKYRLELIHISDVASTEYTLVVGNIGFKSVASLKKFLGDLPEGSILEWNPGCIRWGGEPLLSSREDMEDFKEFCVAKKIKFILVPSG